MKPPMPRSSRRGAFSLLELMLALALAGMLGVSIYQTLSITLRAKDTARAAVDLSRTAMVASEIVRQDLETILPPTGVLAGQFYGERQSGAQGLAADFLSFYAIGADHHRLPDDPLAEGIRYVELSLDTSQNPPVLIRRIQRNLLASTQDEPETEILCRGVRAMEIAYFDGSVWTDSWDSTANDDALPAAVSITLEFERPGMQPGQNGYRVRRVIPLACVKPEDSGTTGSTGSTGGAAR